MTLGGTMNTQTKNNPFSQHALLNEKLALLYVLKSLFTQLLCHVFYSTGKTKRLCMYAQFVIQD